MKKIRLRFEKVIKMYYNSINIKLYYLGAGNNLYLVEYLSKYQVYFNYDFSESIFDNVRRCFRYMKYRILDEMIRRLEDE